jgi:hypothetical protein
VEDGGSPNGGDGFRPRFCYDRRRRADLLSRYVANRQQCLNEFVLSGRHPAKLGCVSLARQYPRKALSGGGSKFCAVGGSSGDRPFAELVRMDSAHPCGTFSTASSMVEEAMLNFTDA